MKILTAYVAVLKHCVLNINFPRGSVMQVNKLFILLYRVLQ